MGYEGFYAVLIGSFILWLTYIERRQVGVIGRYLFR